MATTTNPGTSGAIIALRFDGEALRVLDQTALPWRELELELHGAEEVATAIRCLAIRGAPLIGVAAAYGVALELRRGAGASDLARACRTLRGARPTAVNLTWAVQRVRVAAESASEEGAAAAALAEAQEIHAWEEMASAAMARHGAELLSGARRILTHCNTGALAAPGRGTALAVIAELHARGELEHVVATESRPLLQGARLTAYELRRLGAPHTLIVDSAAAGLIAAGAVDAVVVGCDRVAANGDVANKVGTYGLALAAQAANTPFVVVGPTSTVDLECVDGASIDIEERPADEVLTVAGTRLADGGTHVRNPAFDRTPAALITALVTERGTVRPVGRDALEALMRAPA